MASLGVVLTWRSRACVCQLEAYADGIGNDRDKIMIILYVITNTLVTLKYRRIVPHPSLACWHKLDPPTGYVPISPFQVLDMSIAMRRIIVNIPQNPRISINGTNVPVQTSETTPGQQGARTLPNTPPSSQQKTIAKSTKCETRGLAWYLPNPLPPKTHTHTHTHTQAQRFPYLFRLS